MHIHKLLVKLHSNYLIVKIGFFLIFHLNVKERLIHGSLFLYNRKNLVSINDVLLSLKRFQKVPDDVRMQKVLEVLDTDKDGLIDINHVLKVW